MKKTSFVARSSYISSTSINQDSSLNLPEAAIRIEHTIPSLSQQTGEPPKNQKPFQCFSDSSSTSLFIQPPCSRFIGIDRGHESIIATEHRGAFKWSFFSLFLFPVRCVRQRQNPRPTEETDPWTATTKMELCPINLVGSLLSALLNITLLYSVSLRFNLFPMFLGFYQAPWGRWLLLYW